MNYWLVKQEPESYSFEDFQKDKTTIWDGVRNYQARNYLKEMKKGDKVLYYHSGKQKAVAGISEIVKEHFTDPGSEDERWVAVELKSIKN